MSITDYVPHSMVAALGAIATYVFREHVKADERRFTELKADTASIGDKLDRHYTALMKEIKDAAAAAASAAGEAKAAREIISSPLRRRKR